MQGTNFKASVFPLQYESALERSVRTGFTGALALPWLRAAPRVQQCRAQGWASRRQSSHQPSVLHHPPRPQGTAWR